MYFACNTIGQTKCKVFHYSFQPLSLVCPELIRFFRIVHGTSEYERLSPPLERIDAELSLAAFVIPLKLKRFHRPEQQMHHISIACNSLELSIPYHLWINLSALISEQGKVFSSLGKHRYGP